MAVNFEIYSQDILVIRETGKEVKCEVVDVNDSLITYKEWHSDNDSIYEISRFEVESYSVGKRSAIKKVEDESNSHSGILSV